jgi:hypothetical protein
VTTCAVIRRIAADMAFTTRQKIFDPLSLVVSQSKALHGSAFPKPTTYESRDN